MRVNIPLPFDEIKVVLIAHTVHGGTIELR